MSRAQYVKNPAPGSVAEKCFALIYSLGDSELAGLKVAELSKRLKYNRAHLSRAFSIQAGKPLEWVLQREKLFRASGILAESGEPIKQLAKRVGFSRSDYFSKLFKEQFGVTPVRYRQLLRKRRTNRQQEGQEWGPGDSSVLGSSDDHK